MRIVSLGIALLIGALILCGAPARAAGPAVEMVRQRGLLLMGPIQQSVSLRYEYYGRDGENNDSSTHRFREKYSLDTSADVWDPDLLQVNLAVDFWLEQMKDRSDAGSSQSSDSRRITYSLVASAFEYEPFPVVFRSSREETTSSNSFAPHYTTTYLRNSIAAKVQNKVLPARFYYMHLSSETSGRARDSSSTMDNLSLLVNHNFRNISHTQMDVNLSEGEHESEYAGETESSHATLSFLNALYLDRQRKYSLSSHVSISKAEVAGDRQRTLALTETLRAQFGRALIGDASYHYTSEQIPGFDGRDQDFTTRNIDLNLTHSLYQSLQSRLNLHRRESELNGGDESGNRVGLWFNYRKTLPRASFLLVNFGGSHEETDRTLNADRIRVIRRHIDVKRNEPVTLDVLGGTLLQVESVVGKAENEPDRLFFAGIDYEVDTIFAQIIPIGSDFPDPVLDPTVPGLTIEVTYVVGVDRPDIEYATDIRQVSSTLSLLEGRYRILTRYYEENQDLLEGDTSAGLYDLTETEVRFESRINYHRFGLEYGTHEAGVNKYEYLEGEWFYDRMYPWGNVRLQARDRYTMYETANTNRSDYDVNTLTLGSSYSRRLYAWAQLVLSLNYVNTRSNYADRDAVYFRSSLYGRINQLYFTLNGTSMLRMEEDRTTRDDFFNVEITRYF